MTQEDLTELLGLPEFIEEEVLTSTIDEWCANSERLFNSESVRGRYPAGTLKTPADARKYVGSPIDLTLQEVYGNHTWRVNGPLITCHVAGGKGLEYKTYKLYYAHNAAGETQKYEETLDALEHNSDSSVELWGFDLIMQRVGYKILK